ncbi:Multidrug efflux system EmrAB-OMF membrane fusion protein EmrA [Marinomonas primoryensis]|uniref:Multidrug efflux system EmrAB-OMF membrane fusion protein EmrA n=2 Tax=Marinomonas primoryensis TaxID=178399 RepID=A0A859CSV8_9GAMM|nr:Multidrug efflux system EmrAB-OMF membrane fusion protein EmrA [Marinomonas primoryensis]|tara:strand:- start:16225 stop:17427 length:1203 start_codon:yes stop_codon:yes gene_type:complete
MVNKIMQDNVENTVAPKKSKRKKSLIILFGIVVLGAVGTGWYYEEYVVGNQTTDDAYVNGNIVSITPETVGTVTQITVDSGDFVQKGQVLVRFDEADADLEYDNAKAKLAQAVRQVRAMFNNVTQAEAVVDANKIALHKAERDYDRRKNMVKAGGLSQEDLSHAKDMVDSAQTQLAVAVEQLKSQSSMISGTTVETHPTVRSAITNVKQAYLTKQRTNIVAPVTGYVARRQVQLGQRVSPSSILMAVVPLDEVWVDANFKETQMDDMRIGQPVALISDLYGDKVVFHGTIESLGIGTGSAFSVLPAQNATGNWIKIVQRLPVRITLDAQDIASHPLRIGLSMNVEVDTANTSGKLLSTTSPEKPRFVTNAYHQPMENIQQTISQIIKDNDAQLNHASTNK